MDSISSGEGWFHIGSDGQGEVVVYLFGEIPADAEDFCLALREADSFDDRRKAWTVRNITLFLNSGGGNVSSALSVANSLMSQRSCRGASITCEIVGVSGSAAVVIAAVADEVRMASDGFLHLHSAFYPENRPADARLAEMNAAMIRLIAAKAKCDKKDIQGLLVADTWLSAEEAVSLGFADAVSAVD